MKAAHLGTRMRVQLRVAQEREECPPRFIEAYEGWVAILDEPEPRLDEQDLAAVSRLEWEFEIYRSAAIIAKALGERISDSLYQEARILRNMIGRGPTIAPEDRDAVGG